MSTPYQQAVGEVRGEKLPTIEVAGEIFTLRGMLTSLDVSEMARMGDVDSASPEGMAALADVFRAAFGTDLPSPPVDKELDDADPTRVEDRAAAAAARSEYARFRRHLRAQRNADDMVVEAVGSAVEALSGFPTEQQSSSQGSPSTSTPGSRDGGQPPAVPGLPAVTTPMPAEVFDGAEQVVVNIGRRAS